MHLLVPQTLEGAGAVWSFKSAKDGVRNRSVGRMHTPARPRAQFSKCQAKSASAHYAGCWQRFSLLYGPAL